MAADSIVNLHLVKFNENAKEIINSYVAESTSKAYKSALARFFRWHSKSSTPEKVATFEDFLNYAGILYKESGSVNIVNLFLFSLIDTWGIEAGRRVRQKGSKGEFLKLPDHEFCGANNGNPIF